jgi:sugar lactone lactonase YvrE
MRTPGHSFAGVVCAGTVLLMAFSAPAQNLFVADEYNNTIIEIAPSGLESTFASGIWQAGYLTFNKTGDLFAGVVGGIIKITPGGVQSYFSFDAPYGLAFNSAGILFGADYNGGNIYAYTPEGVRSTFASGLSWPTGLAFNSADHLFVGNVGDGNIYEYTPGGARSTFATGLSYPTALAFNNEGDLFVADEGSGTIIEITPGGVRSTFASGLSNPFGGPTGLAFSGAGDLFVAVPGNGGHIYEFTPDGTQSTFDSGMGQPNGLAFQFTPEPSVLELLAVGATILLVRRRRRNQERISASK